MLERLLCRLLNEVFDAFLSNISRLRAFLASVCPLVVGVKLTRIRQTVAASTLTGLGCVVTLRNNDLLGLDHLKVNARDNLRDQFKTVAKDPVRFKSTFEEEGFDFVSEAGGNELKKVLQLALLIQCLLDVLKVRHYARLDLVRQLHVFHGCVGGVDLVLELGSLLVQF